MRPVAPVHEDTDERVIHRAELLDGFVGSREKTFDAIARTAESFQGALQLDRGLLGVWLSQIVGFGAVIARPENTDFGFGHLFSFTRRVSYDFLGRVARFAAGELVHRYSEDDHHADHN